jgi:hypothetical protein
MIRRRSDTHRQRGIIIVWFALFMTSTLGFVALGVDLAKLAATKTQLQNAADGAALAAAASIHPQTGKIDPLLARYRAASVGMQNEAFIDRPRPVSIEGGDVQILEGNLVRVEARRQGDHAMVTSLAGILGIKKLEARAVAWAKADTAGLVCRMVPIGILPPAPGRTFQVGCGNVYRFRHGRTPGGNGNYRPVLLPPCQDGACPTNFSNNETMATFECLVRNDYQCCIGIKDWIFIQRADWIVAMRRAIDDRWASDTDQRPNICYAQYRGNGRRILYMPITTPEVMGDAGVWVTSMVAFFLHQRVGPNASADLVGEFVHAVAPGSPAGSDPHAHEHNGPVTYTVHLVSGPDR